MNDVIVIGAGYAGLMATAALCQRGFRPLVLTKGNGTTHWSHGCIDLLGYQQNGYATPVDVPEAGIDQLVQHDAAHPYALAGRENLHAALEHFREIMAGTDYPFTGSLSRNIMVPTATGALRPTAFLPLTMAAGDMRLGGEILVVGFRELRDFFPPMIAANLRAQGYAARSAYIEMPPSKRRLDYFPTVLARLFDDEGFRSDVIREVRAVRGTATRIAFPAVLGFEQPLQTLRHLQEGCGTPVFEIPMLPPSVPGIRIWERMKRTLVAWGARFEIGSEVERGEGDGTAGGRIVRLWSEAAARPRLHCPRGVVLTTGGIAGGGIEAGEAGLRETALQLPVIGPSGHADWFSPDFHGDHLLFRAGIRVDSQFRPCDAAGHLIYSNVTVAGGSLVGADAIRERSLEGIALATGWAAGQRLADMLQAQ